ncbi:MAG: type IVB secretion system protein IcmH/DotU, partial [Gammaproteobacteria bacterium]
PSPPHATPPPPSPAPAVQAPLDAAALGVAQSALVGAATSLLVLAPQLRNSTRHPDVAGLRDHLIREIRAFENNARTQGASPESVLAGRYALCTFLDESVLSTPWGSESAWSSQTLLSTFQNETWGGEKFFAILDRALQDPGRMLDVLELMYVCLALGFEGKYRVLDRGRARLDEVQDQAFRAIRMQRGDFERDLSAHWQGVGGRRNPLVRYVPLWVVGAVAGALLLSMYLGFTWMLRGNSNPVYDQLQQIRHGYTAPAEPKSGAPVSLDIRGRGSRGEHA